jgi:hypothetical protein
VRGKAAQSQDVGSCLAADTERERVGSPAHLAPSRQQP